MNWCTWVDLLETLGYLTHRQVRIDAFCLSLFRVPNGNEDGDLGIFPQANSCFLVALRNGCPKAHTLGQEVATSDNVRFEQEI